jgi:hypothetical protein
MKKSVVTATSLVLLTTSAFADFGQISYESFQRLNTPQREGISNQWLGLNLNAGYYQDAGYNSHIDADARFYFSEGGKSNYSLSEAYFQYKTPKLDLNLGRKITDWSVNQEYWMLGQLNGRQGMELLSTKREGLTGAGFDYRGDAIDLSFLISTVYIPSLNPDMDIVDGKVVTNSEWSRLPPTQTVVQGQTIPVLYRLERPSVKDVIKQNSLGFAGGVKWTGGKLGAYFIYKPENSLRANAEAKGAKFLSYVDVLVKPIVNHHAVYGANLTQKWGVNTLKMGVDVIDPNASVGSDFKTLDIIKLKETNKSFESDLHKVEPRYDRESYAHISINQKYNIFGWYLNAIQILSSNTRGDDFFTETVKWKRTVGIGGHVQLTDSIRIDGDLKYDLKRKDNIFKTTARYRYNSSLEFGAGAELLKSPYKESYWSAYRANDRFFASAHFIF